jgi:hypothetical protein
LILDDALVAEDDVAWAEAPPATPLNSEALPKPVKSSRLFKASLQDYQSAQPIVQKSVARPTSSSGLSGVGLVPIELPRDHRNP